MADAQKASINVFFVIAAFVLVGLIGLGVLYLSGPRENIGEGETTSDSIRTSSDAVTLDTLRQGLVLSEYTLKPSATRQVRWIRGAVGTSEPCIRRTSPRQARATPR